MPTYQYRCPYCHYEFEVFQHITDDPITVCPQCRKTTHRIISGGGGFIFKGSGFYITDHRSENYKSSAAREKSQSSPPADKTAKTEGVTSKTVEKKT